MSLAFCLSAADLAALLSSRICHDLISPVGAINNAMELYDEMQGEGADEALELIRLSAASASARLQFARLAYGAAGSQGAELDTGMAENVAQLYMEHEKPKLHWQGERLLLPKNDVKLLLNLLLVANTTLPRGGDISVLIKQETGEGSASFTLTCSAGAGQVLQPPQNFLTLYHAWQAGDREGNSHEETIDEASIDAHAIQPYYTLLLASLTGKMIEMDFEMESLVFRVKGRDLKS